MAQPDDVEMIDTCSHEPVTLDPYSVNISMRTYQSTGSSQFRVIATLGTTIVTIIDWRASTNGTFVTVGSIQWETLYYYARTHDVTVEFKDGTNVTSTWFYPLQLSTEQNMKYETTGLIQLTQAVLLNTTSAIYLPSLYAPKKVAAQSQSMEVVFGLQKTASALVTSQHSAWIKFEWFDDTVLMPPWIERYALFQGAAALTSYAPFTTKTQFYNSALVTTLQNITVTMKFQNYNTITQETTAGRSDINITTLLQAGVALGMRTTSISQQYSQYETFGTIRWYVEVMPTNIVISNPGILATQKPYYKVWVTKKANIDLGIVVWNDSQRYILTKGTDREQTFTANGEGTQGLDDDEIKVSSMQTIATSGIRVVPLLLEGRGLDACFSDVVFTTAEINYLMTITASQPLNKVTFEKSSVIGLASTPGDFLAIELEMQYIPPEGVVEEDDDEVLREQRAIDQGVEVVQELVYKNAQNKRDLNSRFMNNVLYVYDGYSNQGKADQLNAQIVDAFRQASQLPQETDKDFKFRQEMIASELIAQAFENPNPSVSSQTESMKQLASTLRHGMKTSPDEWFKNADKATKDVVEQLRGYAISGAPPNIERFTQTSHKIKGVKFEGLDAMSQEQLLPGSKQNVVANILNVVLTDVLDQNTETDLKKTQTIINDIKESVPEENIFKVGNTYTVAGKATLQSLLTAGLSLHHATKLLMAIQSGRYDLVADTLRSIGLMVAPSIIAQAAGYEDATDAVVDTSDRIANFVSYLFSGKTNALKTVYNYVVYTLPDAYKVTSQEMNTEAIKQARFELEKQVLDLQQQGSPIPDTLTDSKGRVFVVKKVLTGGSPIYTIAQKLINEDSTRIESPATLLDNLIKGTLKLQSKVKQISYTVSKRQGVDSSPEEDAKAFSQMKSLGAGESLLAYGQLVGVIGRAFTPEEVYVLTNPVIGTKTVEYRSLTTHAFAKLMEKAITLMQASTIGVALLQQITSEYFSAAMRQCMKADNAHGFVQYKVMKSVVNPQGADEQQLRSGLQSFLGSKPVYDAVNVLHSQSGKQLEDLTRILQQPAKLQNYIERIAHSLPQNYKQSFNGQWYVQDRTRREYSVPEDKQPVIQKTWLPRKRDVKAADFRGSVTMPQKLNVLPQRGQTDNLLFENVKRFKL